jgi:hypothetical protein
MTDKSTELGHRIGRFLQQFVVPDKYKAARLEMLDIIRDSSEQTMQIGLDSYKEAVKFMVDNGALIPASKVN